MILLLTFLAYTVQNTAPGTMRRGAERYNCLRAPTT